MSDSTRAAAKLAGEVFSSFRKHYPIVAMGGEGKGDPEAEMACIIDLARILEPYVERMVKPEAAALCVAAADGDQINLAVMFPVDTKPSKLCLPSIAALTALENLKEIFQAPRHEPGK